VGHYISVKNKLFDFEYFAHAQVNILQYQYKYKLSLCLYVWIGMLHYVLYFVVNNSLKTI
jgi:hypothetical protein